MEPILTIAAAAIAFRTGTEIGKIFCQDNDSELDILDAKIAVADERIAAKKEVLNQLTSKAEETRKEVEQLRHQVNSWKKATKRTEN